MNSAAQIGQQVNNAGAARASGYVGTANAINGGIGGVNSALQNYLLLQQLGKTPGAPDYGKSELRANPQLRMKTVFSLCADGAHRGL
jgi:hypothetical protein